MTFEQSRAFHRLWHFLSQRPFAQIWANFLLKRAMSFCFCLGVCAFYSLQSAGHDSQARESSETRIVFIGDSLTAGYGVRKEESFPEVLEQLLAKKNKSLRQGLEKVMVTNAGISGSLSSSAVSRVRFSLKQNPQILVLELGGNDALKGTANAVIKKNLAEAIDLAQKNKVKVLLIGMKIYSNFGESYTKGFEHIFEDLAKAKKTSLMPFLLEGVALDPALMQLDQKHPNALGHQKIAQNLMKYLEPLISSK
jgi:acyl-CoA thioesterase-1